MKWASIDIGTNSCRLLVLEGVTIADLKVVEQRISATRIGEGLASSGLLGVDGMERTIEALRSFVAVANQYSADRMFVMATAAVRLASNQKEFLAMVKQKLGLEVEVLSGEREAYLSYLGVSLGLQNTTEEPLVLDLGGGSTEFIWRKHKESVELVSIPIGAVVATELSMGDEEIAKELATILATLKDKSIDCFIGVGGTATTLAAIDMQMEQYDWRKVHGHKLTYERILEIFNYLEQLDIEQRKKVKGLQPNRADIILAGVTVIIVIMRFLGIKELFISDKDLLHGKVFDEILRMEEICH